MKPAAEPSYHDLIASEVRIKTHVFGMARLPANLRLDEELGLVLHPEIRGQLLYRNPYGGIYETRFEVTPGGDFLLMFPDTLPNTNRVKPNGHYGSTDHKVNRMLALRSSDQGKTWSTPFVPFDQDFNQHGFVPLTPRSGGLYYFGTQPAWDRFNGIENASIGFRRSNDDGRTWSDITYIDPVNDRGFRGMSVMRMTETARGTWLLGTHTGSAWFPRPDGSHTASSRQYILRSDDHGSTWTIHPHSRPGGWFIPEHDRMDEGRPLAVGDEVYMQIRSCGGQLWNTWSTDDGRTWADPSPSVLVHSDAPPMLFLHEDGKTLIAFHHNSHTGSHFNASAMTDRAQLWVSLSRDVGRTWSEPRFVLSSAFAPEPANQGNHWKNYNCSYIDVISRGGKIHMVIPHRWQRALYLSFDAALLERFPTAKDLGIS